jgi:hypothetical protein
LPPASNHWIGSARHTSLKKIESRSFSYSLKASPTILHPAGKENIVVRIDPIPLDNPILEFTLFQQVRVDVMDLEGWRIKVLAEPVSDLQAPGARADLWPVE